MWVKKAEKDEETEEKKKTLTHSNRLHQMATPRFDCIALIVAYVALDDHRDLSWL